MSSNTIPCFLLLLLVQLQLQLLLLLLTLPLDWIVLFVPSFEGIGQLGSTDQPASAPTRAEGDIN